MTWKPSAFACSSVSPVLAPFTGLEMERGLIVTDEFLRTSLPDIYAAGDCALVKNRITGKRQWSAMGSTANIAGIHSAPADNLHSQKSVALPVCNDLCDKSSRIGIIVRGSLWGQRWKISSPWTSPMRRLFPRPYIPLPHPAGCFLRPGNLRLSPAPPSVPSWRRSGPLQALPHLCQDSPCTPSPGR